MRRWIPNQHGAWAFLITPVVVGSIVAGGGNWQQLLLLVGWLAGYCFNFYFGLTVKSWRRSDRFERYRPQQLTYGAIAGVTAAALLLDAPQLAWAGSILLPVFAANLWFISARRERLWLNDLLGVVAATAMGGAAVWLGVGAIPTAAWQMLGCLAAYFAGTVWYVKTMIRERGKRSWLIGSVLWHIAALIATWFVSPWYLVGFIPALVRAAALPGRQLTPKQVGFIEIGLTLAIAWVAATTTTLALAV